MEAMMITVAALLLASILFFSSSKKKTNLPPSGPLGLPIIGHLYLFKKPVHHSLARLSAVHGPILLLRFGSRPVLVVSSAPIAEECFTKNDLNFANRPQLPLFKQVSHNYTTIGGSSYGPHWRHVRRIATEKLLSNHRVSTFTDLRADEVHHLLADLYRQAPKKVELKARLFRMSLNVMMRMAAGRRYYGEGVEETPQVRRFREVVEKSSLSTASDIADFLPFFRFFDIHGMRQKFMTLQKTRDELLQELIEEFRRKENGAGGGGTVEDDLHGDDHEDELKNTTTRKKTMIEVLLDLQKSDPEHYSDEIIKSLMVSLLTAGTDTSSDTMAWAMANLLNNPHVLKKAQEEIDAVVSKTRLITDSDMANIPYVNAIIQETLRLHPIGPLLVPHMSADDCVVGGYHVPGGTMLLVNVHIIHRDPKTWPEPTKFMPERFMDAEGKGMNPNVTILTFGMGRRKCPGEGHALRFAALTLGSLLQCFDWGRVGEEKVNLEEGAGLTMPMIHPLEAICKPRTAMLDVLEKKL